MMHDFAVAALGLSGFVVLLCALDCAAVLWRMWRGDEPVPYRLSRRYWRRKLVRIVCRLAALEAAWEQRKIPRKRHVLAPHVATKRGTVGRRIRRTEYIYMNIVPQTDPHVKGLQVRKVKRY